MLDAIARADEGAQARPDAEIIAAAIIPRPMMLMVQTTERKPEPARYAGQYATRAQKKMLAPSCT